MFQPSSWGVGLYGRCSSKRYYQINGDGKGCQIWRLTAHYDFKVTTTLPRREGQGEGLLFGVEAGVDTIFNYCDRTYHGLHLGTTTPGRTVYGTLTVRLSKGKKLKFSNTNISNSKQNNNEED